MLILFQNSKEVVTKVDKMFQVKNQTVLSSHYEKLRADDISKDDDEDLFGLVRANHDLDLDDIPVCRLLTLPIFHVLITSIQIENT